MGTAAVVYVIGGIAVATVVAAGYWDGNWHELQRAESFWSPPHVLLYASIGTLALATASGLILGTRQAWPQLHRTGHIIATLAVVIVFAAGAWDEWWHRLFGPDPEFSPPHVLLGGGILLATVGMLIGLGRQFTSLDRRRVLVGAVFFLVYAAFVLAVNAGIWLIVYLPARDIYANQLGTELLLDGTGTLLFLGLLRVFPWPGAATAYAAAHFALDYVGAIATHPIYPNLLWYYPAAVLPAVGIDLLRWKGIDIVRRLPATVAAGALIAPFYYVFFLPATLAYAGTWPQGTIVLVLIAGAGSVGALLTRPFAAGLSAAIRPPTRLAVIRSAIG